MTFFSEAQGWLSPKIQFRLLPKKELQTGQSLDWASTGYDPTFHLKHRGAAPKGWYMVSLRITASVPRVTAKLYADYGEGIDEKQALQFSVKSGTLFKRVCLFQDRPVRLRLDPCQQPCEFTVEHLAFTKLTERRARALMQKKLQGRRNLGALSSLDSSPLLEQYNQCFDHNLSAITYAQWMSQVEAPTLDSSSLEAIYRKLANKPLISVLLTTYNTEPELLRQCIESVQGQRYPHWQLCIADDASSHEPVRELLREFAETDKRIRLVLREKNGHISQASNSALELVNGEFVALLDHDDLLAPHALLMMVKAINDAPEAQFFYSDEDKIDEHNQRSEPHFKSSWNRDLFYSHNYITHLAVIQTELVRRIGGFRAGVEGSQDYDLFLRAIGHLGNRQIVHVPHVLYHWRAINGSTALSASQKGYTSKAGLKALRDYFNSTNLEIEVTPHRLNNCYQVRWPLAEPSPLVSLIIPTRDGYELLKQCISSIRNKTRYSAFEILVINNQSQCPKTLAYFRELEQTGQARVVDFDDEFNFSAINNLGVAHARGQIVGLINNDIEVINPDWLDEMVRHASRPDVGCVGAKLFYPDGRIQHAGVVLGIGGVAGHAHKYFAGHHNGYHSRLSLVQNYSAVTAAALLVRKSVYLEVGGLEPLLKVAFNDVDFCLKVREAGYRNVWTPFAELYHHESVSRGFEDTPEKQARFSNEIRWMEKRWGEVLKSDPCYNPNLSLTHEDFSYNTEPALTPSP
ncbi:glycosyl transferase family 2 [Ferrimonas balearica DSM 9799]|uniref:Glycosyl transferase family 2 n=1 Tax=Ferrimonas balearica (strain DSM 9799 / CCM 4581 / KCTC 23876 / PAT) TaxID=550540 RepID=E1SP05_FERBD|nr:glycosyltransferase family 2 protein [Ferrimonas balearica]ADN74654.1 glycosyl transferase family 2 [Ferrimonas balearica DSM 9799]